MKKFEYKNIKISRAILEAETASLWKQIENNKDILIRPYSTFYSVVLLPIFLYQLLSKGDFFKSFRENLETQNRRTTHDILTAEFIESLPASERMEHIGLKDFHRDRDTAIPSFEQVILELATAWPASEAVVICLRKQGFAHATLENYQSIVRSMPRRLEDLLKITNENHLLYFSAQLVDWLWTRRDSLSISVSHSFLMRYHEFFLFLAIFRLFPLTLDERELFPELREFGNAPNVTLGVTSGHRYSQLIHFLFPQSLKNMATEENMLMFFVLTRLSKQVLFLSIGLTMLGDKFIISPLLKKIANSTCQMSRYRIIKYLLPMGWHLDRPLTVKNYRSLEYDDLINENNFLKKSLQKQAPYVKNSRIMNSILTALFLICCIFNLFYTEVWSDQAFAFAPILAGVTIKNILSYGYDLYMTRQVTDRLQQLTLNLKDIFSEISDQHFINSVARSNIKLSYVTIQILNPYKNLPKKHLTTVIKGILNYFNIKINTFDETNISLTGDTNLNSLNQMKKFFEKVLQASSIHYQLGQQLRPVVKQISSKIILEPGFFDLTNPGWEIFTTEIFSPHSKNILGVTVKPEQITIQRQMLFNTKELEILKIVISSAKPKIDIGFSPVLPNVNLKKTKTRDKDIKSVQSSVDVKHSLLPQPITWPLAGVTYPGAEVKSISNARRYILFQLPLQAFDDNKEAYDFFYTKSTQMARSKNNASGIKHGSYLGIDFFSGRQEIYSARIKVLSKYGNCGVLLRTEKGPKGELLYQARSFTTRVHN